MISVPSRVVAATLDTLRSCGESRRECIAYWTSASGSQVVDRVIHPRHRATRVGCEVDGAWVTTFFLDLANRGHQVVAQVHTHPGTFVDHSSTDDVHVLVPSTGFVSIVIPRFAQGQARAGWGIWRLDQHGLWAAAEDVITWSTD